MAHGVDGLDLFPTRREAGLFLECVRRAVQKDSVRIHAWALMPNHFHLLVETGGRPLAAAMQRMLTSFGTGFNRVQGHRGHVFMARYKSILVERETYYGNLVRYIHLNPLKAGIVADQENLARYEWTGHSAITGVHPRSWQDTEAVVGFFGADGGDGLRSYLESVRNASGVTGEDALLDNGNFMLGKRGLINSGCCRTDQRRYSFAGPVLGTRGFAELVASELRGRMRQPRDRSGSHALVERAIMLTAVHFGVSTSYVLGGSRKSKATSARRVLSHLLREIGLSNADIARCLHITPTAVTSLLRSDEVGEDIISLLRSKIDGLV